MTLRYIYQEKRIAREGKSVLEAKSRYLNKLFNTLFISKEDVVKLDIKEIGFSDSNVDLLVEIVYNVEDVKEEEKETQDFGDDYDPSKDVRPLIKSWINEESIKATKTCLNLAIDYTAEKIISAIKKRK